MGHVPQQTLELSDGILQANPRDGFSVFSHWVYHGLPHKLLKSPLYAWSGRGLGTWPCCFTVYIYNIIYIVVL